MTNKIIKSTFKNHYIFDINTVPKRDPKMFGFSTQGALKGSKLSQGLPVQSKHNMGTARKPLKIEAF